MLPPLHFPTMLQQSYLQATQPEPRSHSPLPEPGVLVPAHTLHTWMQASPGMLTLSYSSGSNASLATGLPQVLLAS